MSYVVHILPTKFHGDGMWVSCMVTHTGIKTAATTTADNSSASSEIPVVDAAVEEERVNEVAADK